MAFPACGVSTEITTSLAKYATRATIPKPRPLISESLLPGNRRMPAESNRAVTSFPEPRDGLRQRHICSSACTSTVLHSTQKSRGQGRPNASSTSTKRGEEGEICSDEISARRFTELADASAEKFVSCCCCCHRRHIAAGHDADAALVRGWRARFAPHSPLYQNWSFQ